MHKEEYCRFLYGQPGSRAALPSAAGAAASARGRVLDDSALGWPGAGASPARLVGSGRAGAPLEAPLRSGGEEAPRSTRLGRAAGDTDRYGLRQGFAGRRAGRGAAGRAWVGRRPLGLRFRWGLGPARGERGAGSPGRRCPALGLSELPRGARGRPSLRWPRACRPHGDPGIQAPEGAPATGSGCLTLPGPGSPIPRRTRRSFQGPGSMAPWGRGGVSARVFPPDPRPPRGNPGCEPSNLTPKNRSARQFSRVSSPPPFSSLLRSCSAMAHQASDLFPPLASRGHALVERLLLGVGPSAPFPPGCIWEVGGGGLRPLGRSLGF